MVARRGVFSYVIMQGHSWTSFHNPLFGKSLSEIRSLGCFLFFVFFVFVFVFCFFFFVLGGGGVARHVLVNCQQLGYIKLGPQDYRLTILSAATYETELGDHDFCLSRSHYTDTDPTTRERVASDWIGGAVSSVGRARDSWSGGPGFDCRCSRPPPCDRLRQKSWSLSSVSGVAARKIVRRSVLGPVRNIT